MISWHPLTFLTVLRKCKTYSLFLIDYAYVYVLRSGEYVEEPEIIEDDAKDDALSTGTEDEDQSADDQ